LKVHDVEKESLSSIPVASSPARRLLQLHRKLGTHLFRVRTTESDSSSETSSPGIEIEEYLDNLEPRNSHQEEPPALHTYRFALPKGIRFEEDCISRTARRIVYRVHYRALLSHSRSQGSASPVAMDALWVSHLDGSHLHEIGYVSGADEDEEDTPDYLSHRLTDVNWMPDGKRIEFCYHGALYTLRVP
jgi:hypothetical protein